MNRLFLLALFNFMVMPNQLYADQLHQFEIISGKVTQTPARCLTKDCPSKTARLFGTFAANISSNSVQLSNIQVSTSPDISFKLPSTPSVSNNGAIYHFNYKTQGNRLIASGAIDSRAFDGPLEKYSFIAKTVTISEYQEFEQYDFYTVRRDLRTCAIPQCGGYFVKKLNDQKTQCADGQFKNECYVSTINYEKIHLKNIQFQRPILLQGAIQVAPRAAPEEKRSHDSNTPSHLLGLFIAKAAYRPVTNKKPNGVFVGLQDNGTRCIASPCFSTDQYILNHDEIRMISNYNLEKAGATQKSLEQAYRTIAEGGVVLASGINKEDDSNAEPGINFVADQFYVPLKQFSKYTRGCPDGYELTEGFCKTPIGCNYPKLELWVYGGAAPDNSTENIAKSCVSSCVFDFDDDLPPLGGLDGPGRCSLYIK